MKKKLADKPFFFFFLSFKKRILMTWCLTYSMGLKKNNCQFDNQCTVNVINTTIQTICEHFENITLIYL